MPRFVTFQLLAFATIVLAVLTGLSYFYTPANFETGVVCTIIAAAITYVWNGLFKDVYEEELN